MLEVKQVTVSQSSTEAEYKALSSATSELLWILYLLHDLGVAPSSGLWKGILKTSRLVKTSTYCKASNPLQTLISQAFPPFTFLTSLMQTVDYRKVTSLIYCSIKILASSQ